MSNILYKVLVIQMLLLNNEIVKYGDEVPGNKFVDKPEVLVKQGYIEKIVQEKSEQELAFTAAKKAATAAVNKFKKASKKVDDLKSQVDPNKENPTLQALIKKESDKLPLLSEKKDEAEEKLNIAKENLDNSLEEE